MGYLHNVHMSQVIPCTAMHGVTGTYTLAAGAVADTIVLKRGANAATGVITIPIIVPSNSVALKGSKLMSVEVDYELLDAVAVGVVAVLNKIVYNADGAAPTVTQPAITQDLAAGVAAVVQDQHKMTVTVTTPEWTDDDVVFELAMSFECGAAVIVDVLAAVANFELRV